MLNDSDDLALHRIPFALAQILDLLRDVLPIEAVVAGAQAAQYLSLVLSPGVKIIVVAGSVGHAISLEARRDYSRSCGFGRFFGGSRGLGGAAGDAEDRHAGEEQKDSEHDKALRRAPPIGDHTHDRWNDNRGEPV